MKRQLITAMLVLSLLSATAMGQKTYQQPPTRTPDEFRGAEPTVPVTTSSIGDLRWFEVFQDKALQDLLRTALDQNYDLRLAVARINQARANVGLARSNQFPQFNVGADITTTRESAAAFPIPGFTGLSTTFGEAFLNLLTFEVDLWGRLRQQTKAAR